MFSAYKESMISKLLLNDFYDEEELERNFNFPKKDSLYVAAVLDIYIKNAEIWNQEDKKLCHYAICNVMGDIFKEAMSFGTCMNENGMICIVFRLYHEDNAELQIQGAENLVRLEARQANTEGKNSVTIRDLIKASLRMRPDRIVVGEVRGEEALDMIQSIICTI